MKTSFILPVLAMADGHLASEISHSVELKVNKFENYFLLKIDRQRKTGSSKRPFKLMCRIQDMSALDSDPHQEQKWPMQRLSFSDGPMLKMSNLNNTKVGISDSEIFH